MSQCQILQNLPRAAGSMPWWSLCVALKGRFQAGGLNVVADQYTVYLVFVWAAQNQTGMTVSVSWPSNICPSKSIWRGGEKKKKVLVTRFTIVKKKKTFKKKSLSYEHFSAAVVAAFKQNDLQAPACAPSCYLKTAACNWSTECNLHPSTEDQCGPWNPSNKSSWKEDASDTIIPATLSYVPWEGFAQIVSPHVKWQRSINTLNCWRSDSKSDTNKLN